MDWKTITDVTTTFGTYASHGVKEAGPILVAIRDVSVTLFTAIYSALNTAWVAFQEVQSGSKADSVNPSASGGDGEGTTELNTQQGSSSPSLSRRVPFQKSEDDNLLVDLQ